MYKVLVVEDSPDIYSIVAAALAPLNLHLMSAETVADAEKLINKNTFDLVILDLSLPDGDGLTVLGSIRKYANQQKIPVMILSSKSDITSKLSAFSIGADDYVTKPFNVLELRARVESKLRRLAAVVESEGHMEAGPLVLEANKLHVLVKDTQTVIPLSPIEFRMLALLARHRGNIYSRDQILDQIWGQGVHVTDRTIDTHIYTLRKKLGRHGELIKSVQGEGYRFVENFDA